MSEQKTTPEPRAMQRYGGPLEEARAWLATVFVHWAMVIHARCVLDMCDDIAAIKRGGSR